MTVRHMMLAGGAWIAACLGAAGQDALVVGEGFQRALAGSNLAVWRDASGAGTVADALAPDREARFSPALSDCPSFGYSRDVFWLRLVVRSVSAKPVQLVVELENARFRQLDWYVFSGGRPVYHEAAGNERPDAPVAIRAPSPALPVSLEPGQEAVVLLRAASDTSIMFPLAVYHARAYTDYVMRRDAWNYGHMGLSMALCMISVFLGLVLRDRLFVLHAGVVAAYLAHSWIYTGCYVWMRGPAAAYVTAQGMLGFGVLCMIFLTAYVMVFFGPEMRSKMRTAIRILLWAMAGCLVLVLVMPYMAGIVIMNVVWLVANAIGAGTSVWKYLVKKRKYWRFNLLAWAISAGLVALILLEYWGVAPMLLSPEVILRIMLTVIAILLLVAIVDRQHLLAVQVLNAREADRSLAEARFQTLRYQINPHFLFNTLNSIEALSREQPARIPELVRRLSTFLRTTLNVRRDAFTSFRREIESAQAYLGIESVRFEDRLAVEFDVAAGAGECRVPELILQPLVENAIKYGMTSSAEPLKIRIVAHFDAGQLVVKVENTGRWVARGPGREGGSGLENLRQRLTHLYGPGHVPDVAEAAGRVVATIRLPIEREAGV